MLLFKKIMTNFIILSHGTFFFFKKYLSSRLRFEANLKFEKATSQLKIKKKNRNLYLVLIF